MEIEYWDVLDENRKFTGRIHNWNEPLPKGNYHLIVHAWICNSKGEFLTTRRAFELKRFPGMWEVPSGAAMAGESSLTAAIRETKEESGITLLPENAKLFSSTRHDSRHDGTFHDNWLFRQEYNLSDVVLQDGETIDAKTANYLEISDMMACGEFIGRDIFSEFGELEVVLSS